MSMRQTLVSPRPRIALGIAILLAMLLALPAMSSAGPGAPLTGPGGIEARWKLDEGTGTTTADTSGGNHTGTLTSGPAWVPGRSGMALSFDGTNDHVRVTRTAALEPAAVTFACWIKRSGSQATWAHIGGKTFQNDAASPFASYILHGNPNGVGSDRLNFETGHSGGPDDLDSTAGALPDGAWVHVVGTYDPAGAAPQKKLYVNGVLNASKTLSTALVYDTTSTGDFYLGNAGGSSPLFKGAIDEARVYNRALSASEVAQLFESVGLEARWRMDEGTGTTAADSSGNGFTGTLTNGLAWASGKTGNALSFDGTNDYLNLGTNLQMVKSASAATVTAWVNLSSLPASGAFREIAAISVNAGGPTAVSRLALAVTGDGTAADLFAGGRSTDTEAQQNHTADANISTGTWTHVGAVIDFARNTIRIYKDGALIGSKAVSFSQSQTPNTDATNSALGAQDDGSGNFFHGLMDDVRVYSRALGASEIKDLATEPGLVGLWRLDEGTGATAIDSSEYSTNGTLTNGPAYVTGQLGKALQLDGVNDFVNLGTSVGVLRNVSETTLAYWVNLDSGFGNTGGLSFSVGPPPGTSASSRAALEILSTGAIRAVGRASDTESGKVLDSATGQVVGGTWAHLAATINYTTGAIKLYKNGTEVASGTFTFAQAKTADTDSKNAAIGSQDDGGSGFLKGKMDDVRVYNRVLSQTEIADLMTQGGKGLAAVYYDNKDWSGTFIQRTDATVNFNFGSGSPDPAIGPDTFSAIWTGQVLAQFTETYTFFTTTDDGVRLSIDGKLIIDNPVDQAATEKSGTILFEAGRKYDLRMEYYENAGLAVAELRWSSPSTTKAVIPQAQLFPTDSIPGPTMISAVALASDLTKVHVRFSERMDKATVTNPANYSITGGLTINSITLSADGMVATHQLSGPATLNSTQLSVLGAIKSASQEGVIPITKTIVAGSTEGIPDSAAVQLVLTTDGNGSVVMQGGGDGAFGTTAGIGETIRVVAAGTEPTTVVLVQLKEQDGASEIDFGDSGSASSFIGTTSGGTSNFFEVALRFRKTGTRKDDASIRALVSTEVRGVHAFTSVSVSVSPPCGYIAKRHGLRSQIQQTPGFAGVTYRPRSHVVDFVGGNKASGTNLLCDTDWPPTDTGGMTSRSIPGVGADAYAYSLLAPIQTALAQFAAVKPQRKKAYDVSEETPTKKPGDPLRYAREGKDATEDGFGTCENATPTDSGKSRKPVASVDNKTGKSIDPSNGEKALDIYDLIISGRGFNYVFRRVYRSHDYRACVASFGSSIVRDFGVNWTYSYADEYLVKDGTGADNTSNYINYRCGQSGGFYVNIAAGKWNSPRENYTQLRINASGDFEIREEDGDVRVYHNFQTSSTPNKNGRLKELKDRNGNRLTCFYEQIDPDNTVTGNEKFVLAFVVDTMGREIRYQYYARTAQTINGRLVTLATSSTGAFGRLATVRDFKGNMNFGVSPQPDFSGQVANRTLTFDYDAEGNLVRCSGPAVGGAPGSNDFPNGKTFRYKYISEADLPGLVSNWSTLANDQRGVVRSHLLHNLTHIWYPNEVKDAVSVNPLDSDAAEVLSYNVTATFDPPTGTALVQGSFLGLVTSYRVGDVNASGVPVEPRHPNGVPSGGTITYAYTDLNPTRGMPGGVFSDPTLLYVIPTLQVSVVDRSGNDSQYIYGGGKNLLEYREFTLDNFRAVEPGEYLYRFEQSRDRLIKKVTAAEGNVYTPTFNTSSSDRFQHGNLLRVIYTPDAARLPISDQTKIEHVYVYEPIYNRPCLAVFGRGADKNNNGFSPPIAEPSGVNRTMTDPYDPSKVLNLRYAIVEFFDFQESPLASTAWGPTSGFTPTSVDGQTVKATEVLLITVVGLPEGPSDTERADSIRTLRSRLSTNLTKLGLGDLNGDGITNPVATGDVVRKVFGSPVLLANTNQARLENDIESLNGGDLINESLPYDQGGTAESGAPGRLQTIVWMFQYNQFGQVTKVISPEGNVATYTYFPENNPDGDTVTTPAPADGRTLDIVTGGYLKEVLNDTIRTYTQQTTGTTLTGAFSNNRGNPPITSVKIKLTYDDVGNIVTVTNGRGIRTEYFVNELDQTVELTRAADISGASTADPPDPLSGASMGPLTAFMFKSRRILDFNNNTVLTQTEDRANTSTVDGNGLKQKDVNGVLTPVAIPQHVQDTTRGAVTVLDGGDPAGGVAFVDTLHLYDRIDNLIETRAEVDATRMLHTRRRFDGNENEVLVVHPEGNATSWVFDERDLIFQQTLGASSRPAAGRYATGDPISFDRPGGNGTAPSTYTFNYDKNQNLIERVDAQDNGGAKSAIHPPSGSGVGDVVRYTYDGYDRKKTQTDPLGNRMNIVYDPDDNIVRVVHDGDPVNDIAGDSDNKTLQVAEYVLDELSRIVVTHEVLFQTPDVVVTRAPTLTDTPTMDGLAAYLGDSPSDTAAVPGTLGVSVIARISTISEYDRESRLTFRIRDDLDVDRTAYDGASRVIEWEDSARANGFNGGSGSFDPANIDGNSACLAYDDNNNLIERKSIDVTAVAGIPNEEFRMTFIYDSLDRLQTTFDNRGQASDYRYNSRDSNVVSADAVSPAGDESARTLNRRGCGTTAPVAVNKFGNVTRQRYDGISRLLETEAVLTSTSRGDGINIGATLEGVLSATPLPDSGQSGDGLISAYYAWDDNSQLLGIRDDDGNSLVYIRDNQGRNLCELKGQAFTGIFFGPVTCPRSGLTGDSGTFGVSLRGGVSPVDTEPAGTDIDLVYDKDSNLITRTDEAGNVFNYTLPNPYDALNRRRACTITRATAFIGTTKQTWAYDGLSRLTECFDNNEEPDNDPNSPPFDTTDDVVCKFFFDSLARNVEESQQVGSLTAKVISSNFDIAAGGAVFYPSAHFYPDNRRIDSTYDKLDRLVSRRDNGEPSDIGKYDYIGQWRIALLTFQNRIRLTHMGQSGGQNADLGFDDLRRIVKHRWEHFAVGDTSPGDDIRRLQFEYQDGTGASLYNRENRARIEHKDHDPANSEQYKYDSAYRLTSPGSGSQGLNSRGFERGSFADAMRISMGSVTFFQDWDLEGVGNWTREDDNGRVETRTHSDFNEIVDRLVSGNTATLTYDKNGNTTDTGYISLAGQSFPGGGLRVEFDAFNRIKKIHSNNNIPGTLGTVKAEYVYDFRNRRVRKRLPGPNGQLDAFGSGNDDVATDYYYLDWNVVEEREPVLTANPPTQDSIAQQYVYGASVDEVWTLDNRRGAITVAQLNDGAANERHFYHSNVMYHVYGLTDETGALKEAYQYDAYGKQTVIKDGPDADTVVNFTSDDVRVSGGSSSINSSPYMYTGQRFDAETGLMYYKNRYYSQDLGRFISRDPVPGLNLYEYVESDPINRRDSSGFQSQPSSMDKWRKEREAIDKEIGGLRFSETLLEVVGFPGMLIFAFLGGGCASEPPRQPAPPGPGPTMAKVKADPDIIGKWNLAYEQSKPKNPLERHEEGGYIVQTKEGKNELRPLPPTLEKKEFRGGLEAGYYHQIRIPAVPPPGTTQLGDTVIGEYHTHPGTPGTVFVNPKDDKLYPFIWGPNPTDDSNAKTAGRPGVVISWDPFKFKYVYFQYGVLK